MNTITRIANALLDQDYIRGESNGELFFFQRGTCEAVVFPELERIHFYETFDEDIKRVVHLGKMSFDEFLAQYA